MLLHSDYPDSNPTVLCSYSLKLEAWLRSNTCKVYSLWFDLTVASLEEENLVVFYYLRAFEIW
jgi:hypothetical protein